MNVKELVIVGEEEIGKTTLANALLGWDIFPQSTWDLYIPTKELRSHMLTDHIRLTDTPGYDLVWYQVPEAVYEAVCRADTIIMMFQGFWPSENDDPKHIEGVRRWSNDLTKKEKLLTKLLSKANTRDIYFVIPFYSEDGPLEQENAGQALSRAKERFALFSDHGEAGFFCIDPRMALIAAVEDDHTALEASGIMALKAALLCREE